MIPPSDNDGVLTDGPTARHSYGPASKDFLDHDDMLGAGSDDDEEGDGLNDISSGSETHKQEPEEEPEEKPVTLAELRASRRARRQQQIEMGDSSRMNGSSRRMGGSSGRRGGSGRMMNGSGRMMNSSSGRRGGSGNVRGRLSAENSGSSHAPQRPVRTISNDGDDHNNNNNNKTMLDNSTHNAKKPMKARSLSPASVDSRQPPSPKATRRGGRRPNHHYAPENTHKQKDKPVKPPRRTKSGHHLDADRPSPTRKKPERSFSAKMVREISTVTKDLFGVELLDDEDDDVMDEDNYDDYKIRDCDIQVIVNDQEEFQRLKLALKEKGAITNGVLQQRLHVYVHKNRDRLESSSHHSRNSQTNNEAANNSNSNYWTMIMMQHHNKLVHEQQQQQQQQQQRNSSDSTTEAP